MAYEGVCLNCFSDRGGYDVCPYCGFVSGTLPAEGYMLHPGAYLWGRYVVGTVLGAGGFGVTYRAWDTRLSAMVAIKEFFPGSLVSRIPGESKVRVFSGDRQESYAAQLARFMEEAKNLAKFTGDPHIVNVLDYFEDNGTAYIVMEYLDGITLKEYMIRKGGRLPANEAAAIAASLLRALSAIHAKGIIHRDISPDNLFILRDGGMKVLDFGAARLAAKEGGELTQGVVVKKGYAPPEQYRTNMKQGVWTDIYAAGATLYKMLTGITPEESIERTERDILRRPSHTGTAVDAAVDKAVMKAMALRPELRFQSADAMLAALENRTVIDFPEVELKKRRKRGRAIVTACALIVIALGALAFWRLTSVPGRIVTLAPAINEDEIEPDVITVLARTDEDGPSPELLAVEKLADAFMKLYPQHRVEIESYVYSADYYADVTPRFLTAEAPSVFAYSIPDLDQEETPYLADLSPLYASLNMNDYLLLGEEYENQLEYDYSEGKAFFVPTSLYFYFTVFRNAGAEARGIEIPSAMTSYRQIIDWERETPGTVEAYNFYDLGDALAYLEPEIRRERNLAALQDRAVEYAEMARAGYFYSYLSDALTYPYDEPMLLFDQSGTSSLRRRREEGAFTVVPYLTKDGEVPGMTTDDYGVSAFIPENRQKLAMLFLRFMLSENGQNLLHVQTDNMLPLHKRALEQYVEAFPELSFLTGEYADKIRLNYGSYSLGDLGDMIDDENVTMDDVRAYVAEEYDW